MAKNDEKWDDLSSVLLSCCSVLGRILFLSIQQFKTKTTTAKNTITTPKKPTQPHLPKSTRSCPDYMWPSGCPCGPRWRPWPHFHDPPRWQCTQTPLPSGSRWPSWRRSWRWPSNSRKGTIQGSELCACERLPRLTCTPSCLPPQPRSWWACRCHRRPGGFQLGSKPRTMLVPHGLGGSIFPAASPFCGNKSFSVIVKPFKFRVALHLQSLSGPLGTGSPGRTPQLSHSSWVDYIYIYIFFFFSFVFFSFFFKFKFNVALHPQRP